MISDDFNRADSYPTGPVVTDGITWLHSVLNFGISGNRLFMDGHANDLANHAAVGALDVGDSNGTFRMTGLRELSGSYYTGVAWRAHWDPSAGNFTSFWYLSSNGDIAKVVGVIPAVTVVTNIGALPDNATVDVECNDDTMTISVNGTPLDTITDSFNSADTYFGVACDNGGGFGSVDSFTWTPIPKPPTITGSIANPFGGPPPWDPGVSFTATETDGDLTGWSVDLGDGSSTITGSWPAGTTSATIDLTGSFAYSAVGTYTVHVTVNAADGSSTTVSLGTVVVNPYAVQFAAGAEGTNTSARGVITHRPIAEAHHFDRHLELSRFYDLDPTLYPPSPIPQRSLSIDVAPYVVATLPMDKPRCGAMSTSVAKARHWAMATDLGAELALGDLGAAARWLPFDGDMVPDSTLSPPGVRWQPHFGAAPWTPGRTFYERGGTPYIDADYTYYASGQRLKHTQAMVHDGTGWFLLDAGVSVSAFTWVMVVVLHHPETRHDYDILCTFQPGADPARARACNLRYEKGEIRAYLNARLSSTRLNAPVYRGRIRPTILVWGESNRHGTLGVVDALGKHWHEYAHPAHGNFPIENFKLGTNPVVGANKYAAIMDVLELSYFTTRLTPAQAAPVVHRLDHVYGVTGR